MDVENLALVEHTYKELNGEMTLDKIVDLAGQGILARIPRDESGRLASVGSINHGAGSCSPCAYWFKGICKYSIACHYCHYIHAGQKSKRLRPSKQTRMRLRRLEAQKTTQSEHDQDEFLLEEDVEDMGQILNPCADGGANRSLEGIIEHL